MRGGEDIGWLGAHFRVRVGYNKTIVNMVCVPKVAFSI
jgi:hypothetical protein